MTTLAVPIRWDSRALSICEPSTSSPPATAHAHACFADDCIAFQQPIWKCQLASNLLAVLGLPEPVMLKETPSTLTPVHVPAQAVTCQAHPQRVLGPTFSKQLEKTHTEDLGRNRSKYMEGQNVVRNQGATSPEAGIFASLIFWVISG